MDLKATLENALKQGEEGIKALTNLETANPATSLSLNDEISKFKHVGGVIMLIFLSVGIFWGVLAPLEGAAVASGKVIVSTNRKKVQHLEGGIVAAMHVKEGSTVKIDEPLVELTDVQAKSRHLTTEYNLLAAYARVTRLLAERDNKPALDFDWPKVSPQVARKIPDLQKQELEIISYRRNEVRLKRRELNQQIQQLKNDVEGYTQQRANVRSKLKLAQDRLKIAKNLKKDQLFSQDQYLTLQMQETEYRGELQNIETQLKNLKEEIKRKDIEYENVVNLYQKQILEELQQYSEELQTVREQTKEIGDILGRTLIRAPQSGIVTGMMVTNIGQVISPGEVLMEIVPQDDSLIIEARVMPQDIDNVFIGQKAKIVLVPYRARYLPTIMAEVQNVSPDIFVDKQTGESYYTARLVIGPEYLEHLDNIELYPGMPTEVFMVTEARSMFTYLIDPLRQSFRHAFREE